MSENVSYIPARLKSMAVGGHVAGTEDIYDDKLQKTQESINEETVGTTGSSLSSRVSTLEQQVAFEGTIEVEDNPANIVSGNGKVTSANAVAGAISAALMTIDEEPTEDSSNAVSSGGVYDALQEKYEKPVAGIPSSDMTEGVQTALSKANTALQRDDIADLVTEQGMTLYVEEALQPVVTLIPTQASTTNQLADKDFVNSSIATSTGTFRGDYNSLADLENIPNPKLNDYAYYVVGTSTGTLYKRYKYTTTGWEFEYDINNSSFTAAQWAAINSQATQELTAKLSALPTASELNTEFGGKQDTIDDLAAIRSGASLGATAVQTETDPTVPSWAKQQSKPSYSYSEISGTPTNVSTFVNDAGYLTQHQDISGKAEKSEMSVTAGTGADADKTTIQLKTGTSATVLTQHQDISGKAEKNEMAVTPGTGTDADKTTITLKTGTSATVLTAHQDISNLIASQSVRNVVVLTQQEYDALATKDNYTEYNIV